MVLLQGARKDDKGNIVNSSFTPTPRTTIVSGNQVFSQPTASARQQSYESISNARSGNIERVGFTKKDTDVTSDTYGQQIPDESRGSLLVSREGMVRSGRGDVYFGGKRIPESNIVRNEKNQPVRITQNAYTPRPNEPVYYGNSTPEAVKQAEITKQIRLLRNLEPSQVNPQIARLNSDNFNNRNAREIQTLIAQVNAQKEQEIAKLQSQLAPQGRPITQMPLKPSESFNPNLVERTYKKTIGTGEVQPLKKQETNQFFKIFPNLQKSNETYYQPLVSEKDQLKDYFKSIGYAIKEIRTPAEAKSEQAKQGRESIQRAVMFTPVFSVGTDVGTIGESSTRAIERERKYKREQEKPEVKTTKLVTDENITTYSKDINGKIIKNVEKADAYYETTTNKVNPANLKFDYREILPKESTVVPLIIGAGASYGFTKAIGDVPKTYEIVKERTAIRIPQLEYVETGANKGTILEKVSTRDISNLYTKPVKVEYYLKYAKGRPLQQLADLNVNRPSTNTQALKYKFIDLEGRPAEVKVKIPKEDMDIYARATSRIDENSQFVMDDIKGKRIGLNNKIPKGRKPITRASSLSVIKPIEIPNRFNIKFFKGSSAIKGKAGGKISNVGSAYVGFTLPARQTKLGLADVSYSIGLNPSTKSIIFGKAITNVEKTPFKIANEAEGYVNNHKGISQNYIKRIEQAQTAIASTQASATLKKYVPSIPKPKGSSQGLIEAFNYGKTSNLRTIPQSLNLIGKTEKTYRRQPPETIQRNRFNQVGITTTARAGATIIKEKLRQTPLLSFKQSYAQTPRTPQKTTQLNPPYTPTVPSSPFRNAPATATPETPYRPPIIPPYFKLPKPSLSEYKKFGYKKFKKVKKQTTPDFVSLAFSKFGKREKKFVGLERRPLIKNKGNKQFIKNFSYLLSGSRT